MKIVCCKCEVELIPEHNGVFIAEMMNRNTKIYKLWVADKWACPICDFAIVSGFASNPLMEHFQGDIEEKVKELKEQGAEVIYDNEVLK